MTTPTCPKTSSTPDEPHRAARLLLVVLILAFSVSLPMPARAADTPDAAPPPLTEIQSQAQAIRQLTFKRPLTYKTLTPDDVVPLLEREIRRHAAEADLDNLLLAYQTLGLIKSADGLLQRLVEAYAGNLMAFYDHRTHTVYLIDDPALPEPLQRIAELHELLHALQDQHFDLGALPLDDLHHTDRVNAAMALVEGDATLGTAEYAAAHMRLSFSDSIRTVAFAARSGPAMPYLFRRELHFAYADGLNLARALHDKGGWDALNKAFADPPASTEQVLHYKQKYLHERDDPTPVELPNCTPILGHDWTLVADDVLGELYTQVLFRQHLSFLRAAKPSRGWDGDRLHFYRARDDTVLIWRTVWDTERDAAEFRDAYRKVLRRKLRVSDENITQDPLGLLVRGDGRVALVRTSRREVLTVEAPSETIARAVVRHIPAGEPDTNEHTLDEEQRAP